MFGLEDKCIFKLFTFIIRKILCCRAKAELINDRFINQMNMDIVVELQEETIVRVTDITSFKADIPGLSEAAIQKAIFAGLKAAVGCISCSLA